MPAADELKEQSPSQRRHRELACPNQTLISFFSGPRSAGARNIKTCLA
jgi:hypothetical protein